MKLGIFGANGRMSKLLVQDALADESLSLNAVFSRSNLSYKIDKNLMITADLDKFLAAVDLVIVY